MVSHKKKKQGRQRDLQWRGAQDQRLIAVWVSSILRVPGEATAGV